MHFVHTMATAGWVLWLPFSLTVHVPWAVRNAPLVACRRASAPAFAHQTSDMSLTHIKSSEQQPAVDVTLDGLFTYREARPLVPESDSRFSSVSVTKCHRSGWNIGNVGVLTLHAKLHLLWLNCLWFACTICPHIKVTNYLQCTSENLFASVFK